MTVETAMRVLQNNSLRWAVAATFNDPFDVQFDLRVEYDRDRVIDQALANLVDLYMGRRHVPNENKLAQGIKLLRKTAPGLGEAQLRDRFRQSVNEGMDDAEKHMPKNHEEIRQILGALKLLCFSEVHDNLLMWAHYAHHHTGVVIEFSVIDEIDSAWGAAKPVSYRDEMPFLVDEEKLVKLLSGEGTLATTNLFDDAVYVKAIDWAYEKEWRLVGGWEKDKTEELIPFQHREVTAVYLGCRISDADKKKVEALVAEKYKHAPIYLGRKSATLFALEFTAA